MYYIPCIYQSQGEFVAKWMNCLSTVVEVASSNTVTVPCFFFRFYILSIIIIIDTRDVFYVRREVDLMKTAKVNAYIMHIFGKIELLSIHAT